MIVSGMVQIKIPSFAKPFCLQRAASLALPFTSLLQVVVQEILVSLSSPRSLPFKIHDNVHGPTFHVFHYFVLRMARQNFKWLRELSMSFPQYHGRGSLDFLAYNASQLV
jgi:hypothetical protein